MIVEIYVPALDKEYEFLLDNNAVTSIVTDEITSVICEKEQCEIAGESENLMLFHVPTGKKLIQNLSLYENGVIAGDRLILV